MANYVAYDYAVPINSVQASAAPSRDYIRRLAMLVYDKTLQQNATEPSLTVCHSDTDVKAKTTDTAPLAALSAGLNQITLIGVPKQAGSGGSPDKIPTAFDMNKVKDLVESLKNEVLTVLVGNGIFFDAASKYTDVLRVEGGVIGANFIDIDSNAAKTKIFTDLSATDCAFHDLNGADAMATAFGVLLSASNWSNHQYSVYQNAGSNQTVTSVGQAEDLFSKRGSFYISDDSLGTVLGFFVAGHKGILDRYVRAEMTRRIQEVCFAYIQLNEPMNIDDVLDELTLECRSKVFNPYIENGLIESGATTLKIVKSNEQFVAKGDFAVIQPDPLWRVKVTLKG